ncbi:MAG: substrate-binding domain-containing protein [Alphaproteobacteria bacterium]
MPRLQPRQSLLVGTALAATTAVVAGGFPAHADPTADLDPASLVPPGIVGLSQAGDEASDPALAWLTEEECEQAQAEAFEIGIVMQTMNIEWSTEQVRGITDGLARCGATVIGVTNPDFTVEKQIGQIDDMILLQPDAIISIPVDDVATATSYAKVQEAGIKLIMMDNVPAGLQHPADYQTVVSSDSQGLGAVSAAILSEYLPEDATVGVISFGISFYVTNERTRGFKDWMAANRPDVTIEEEYFLNPNDAGSIADSFLIANPNIQGLFTEWSGPGLAAASAARAQGEADSSVTINLEGDVAIELAKGSMIVGLASRSPTTRASPRRTRRSRACWDRNCRRSWPMPRCLSSRTTCSKPGTRCSTCRRQTILSRPATATRSAASSAGCRTRSGVISNA